MTDELKKSEFSKHCWVTYRVLGEEVENDEYSQLAVKLLGVRNFKKMSGLVRISRI